MNAVTPRFRRLLDIAPRQVWLIVAGALFIRVALAIITRYTSEDYMITLRYAENLAHGHGMVYNIGERALGTTTPLYTLFLALASWLHLSPTICGKTVNILADGALCLLLYLWLRHEGLEREGRLAAFIAAVHPLHFQWAISGMETSLVTVTGVWAWYACARGRTMEAFGALALLFLLRWDSLLMTGVVVAAICWRERRAPLKEICLFALIVSPWLIVAGLYYGNPIPVTGQAKMVVYGWFADHLSASRLRYDTTAYGKGVTEVVRLEPTWLLRRLPRQQKLLNFFVGSPAGVALSVTAVTGLFKTVRVRRWTLATASIWFALYTGAFLASRVLLFNWYLVPPFPIFEVLAAIGAIAAIRRAAHFWPSFPHWIPTCALLAATVTPALVMAVTLRQSQAIEENARRPIGLWLNRNSLPEDRVLLEPIGYIGYYSQRPVIDVIGLVSPHVLQFYTNSTTSPWLAQIIRYCPEWCVLRPLELQDIEKAATTEGYDWRSTYTLTRTFSYAPRKNEQPLVFYVFRRVRNSQ